MATKSDLQKQLEAILGHKLDAHAVELLPNTEIAVASYALFDSSEGYVTKESIIATRPKICNTNIPILDVCGFAWTGDDGKIVFRLSQFVVCLGGHYTEPINVVATARTPNPNFLTAEYSFVVVDPVTGANDVEIKISAWHANGKAAADVLFDWRCRAVLWEIIGRS